MHVPSFSRQDPGKYELAGTFNRMYSCDPYDIYDVYRKDDDSTYSTLNEDGVDTQSVEFEDSNISNLRIEKLS